MSLALSLRPLSRQLLLHPLLHPEAIEPPGQFVLKKGFSPICSILEQKNLLIEYWLFLHLLIGGSDREALYVCSVGGSDREGGTPSHRWFAEPMAAKLQRGTSQHRRVVSGEARGQARPELDFLLGQHVLCSEATTDRMAGGLSAAHVQLQYQRYLGGSCCSATCNRVWMQYSPHSRARRTR